MSSIYSTQPPFVIVLLLIGAMMAAAEVGYRIGVYRHKHAGEIGRVHLGAVLSSMLGLVALLLGFTFNISLQRHVTRGQLVMSDANVLNGLYLQSSLIPEPQRKEFRTLLREYVDLRTDKTLLEGGLTQEIFAQRTNQSDDLHRLMWDQTSAMAQKNPPVAGMDTMLTLLRDAHSINRQRIFAYMGRVPAAILSMLLGCVILALGTVGYAGGLREYRGISTRVLLTLFLSGAIFIILDLDQPERGLTPVDQGPMLQIREVVHRDL